jgi:hypothetical protein
VALKKKFCPLGHNLSEVGRYHISGSCMHSDCRRSRDVGRRQDPIIKARALLGNKCSCPECGEQEPLFLTFDHVKNDGYLDRGGDDTLRNARYILKHPSQTKLQLLCMNCNLGKMRNNGVCPHLVVPNTTLVIPSATTVKINQI